MEKPLKHQRRLGLDLCIRLQDTEFHRSFSLYFLFQATDDDFDHGTECLLLAMKYTGTRAKLIHGPDNLWKVGQFLFFLENILSACTKEFHSGKAYGTFSYVKNYFEPKWRYFLFIFF